MTEPFKIEILRRAQEVFFMALLDGYLGEKKRSIKTVSPDGYVTIEFVEGKFKVVDRYCKRDDSISSGGTTTVFFEGKPVWMMAYGGWYEKEVIQFLKSKLRRAYEKGVFYGGRGEAGLKPENGLIYQNFPNPGASFKDFSGVEEICFEGTDRLRGTHNYFGLSLL